MRSWVECAPRGVRGRGGVVPSRSRRARTEGAKRPEPRRSPIRIDCLPDNPGCVKVDVSQLRKSGCLLTPPAQLNAAPRAEPPIPCGVTPCAVRSTARAGRRPAFQAVCTTSAVECHAEGGAAHSVRGYAVRGAERRACRLKPAFQAGGATSAVECHAEGGVGRSVRGYAVRSAKRCACRLKLAFQAVCATSALGCCAEGGATYSVRGYAVRGAEHRACRPEAGVPSRVRYLRF